MHKNLGLSDMEFELMTFFWDRSVPVTFAEILHFCNEVKHWDWVKTTAHTYLTRLMKKGLVDKDDSGKRRVYFAKISREEFTGQFVQGLLDSSFSVQNLLLSLAPNVHLSRGDVEELYQILDRLVEPEDSSQH